ncbi:hypothetical protein [Bacillus weihaiensis]|uniref:Uncharacterized protein n=1 Tax=Bacillus weihaiensis TaxID=1547283 RepID=A0A1L3MV65_9BACI|nr:hypothetical protein [Bacillus weihaiensis]APH06222.1 hypothetical protein A9C19_16545 [Bacillus weihaiensis]
MSSLEERKELDVDVYKLLRERGIKEIEVLEKIEEYVDRGYLKIVGNNKYDATPIYSIIKECFKNIKEDNEFNIKEIVGSFTGQEYEELEKEMIMKIGN